MSLPTKYLCYLLGFIAYPLSKILDCALGNNSKTRFDNTDLK